MRQGDWLIAPASPSGNFLFSQSPSLIVFTNAMPFDPTKPANNSPASSAEMRSQLTSLNADIQQRATINDLNNSIANALAQTSNNSNGVGTLGMSADGSYNQSQMQDLINKVDELINALRR
jgi:hypothetical protein